jgi:alkanesulfonate monooxygenase SsuD/methylene tetrahydromethanopterin reductase-like flavin-dependent oxidoreductase (luciferase family)
VRFGLFGLNMGRAPGPATIADVARAAEGAGFDSLWMGEHVVLPDPRVPPSPMEPGDPALDPIVALAHAAAHTSHLRLATGIIILPQRNPVVLAKELATLDVVSSGRLVFGVGVGYLEPEFRAIGADFAHRGAVTDESSTPSPSSGTPRARRTTAATSRSPGWTPTRAPSSSPCRS